MWRTLSGILIEVRDEQFLKQLPPKLVRLSGKVIEVRALHPQRNSMTP